MGKAKKKLKKLKKKLARLSADEGRALRQARRSRETQASGYGSHQQIIEGESPRVMSIADFAKLGGGKLAYIRMMTANEAKEMFPAVEGIPSGINLFALHAADGTPIALTDSRQSAIGHAMGDELEIASVH